MFAIDFSYFDDGNVESSATQIVHGNFLIAALLVHAVGQSRRRRLVDDAFDFEAGDAPCVLGSLPLGVVKISRYGDYRFSDFFA